jgi:hypothetical protein
MRTVWRCKVLARARRDKGGGAAVAPFHALAAGFWWTTEEDGWRTA